MEVSMKDKFKLSKIKMETLGSKDIPEYVWQILKFGRKHITFPEVESVVDRRVILTMNVDDIILVHNIESIWRKIILTDDAIGDTNILDMLYEINTILVDSRYHKSAKDFFNDTVKEEIKNILNIPCATERAIELLIYCLVNNVFPEYNDITALLIANYIMVKNGCGLLLPPPEKRHILRQMLRDYCDNKGDDIKYFIYEHCIFDTLSV